MSSRVIVLIYTALMILEIKSGVCASIGEEQLLALAKKVNHQDAVHLCQQQGMRLIRVEDEQSNQIVYNFAVKRGLGQYWIDANDRLTEGQWVYEDGSRITYSKWHPGEPNNWNNEDCLQGSYFGNGFWNDIKCDINIAVICFRDKANAVIESISENQLLTLPQKVNQQDAVHLCRQQGMKLIKVQDEQTNQLVHDFAVKRGLGQYWMDANDRASEGQWVYEDGNKITYSKWHPGEPNNWNDEDCLHGSFYGNGFWNDIKCDINNAVICYRDKSVGIVDTETETKPETKTITDTKTITETVSIYLTTEKSNYDEAVQYCKSQNLKLIRIDSAELNKLVVDMVISKGLGTYWIDGNDKNEKGTWLDSDGNKLKYKNFKDGVSNDSDDSHCINGFSFQNEQWNIAECNSKQAVICF